MVASMKFWWSQQGQMNISFWGCSSRRRKMVLSVMGGKVSVGGVGSSQAEA
jgi:hypothetical protein